MLKTTLTLSPELREAYQVHELQQRIQTGKVASALVVFLMPAGFFLDYFVYEDKTPFFLGIRLGCSVLAGVVWFLHTINFGRRHFRFLNLLIPILPAMAIT